MSLDAQLRATIEQRVLVMKRRFQTVDVFAETPFRGNPVAVILDSEGLSTDEMLAITRWMNLSETTFLLPPESPEADYQVRIFTLDREMPFAGHPTLGSCRAWLDAGGEPHDAGTIIQECGAGLVTIRQVDDRLAFGAPPLIRSGEVDKPTIDEVCTFLSIDADEIVDIQWIDNGPGWLGVLLKSAEDVLAIEAPGSHPSRIDVGIVGPYPPGAEAALEIRALFSDHHGNVREDPVTGSLNASVAQWLLGAGRVTSPYVAAQGRVLGRDGRISVEQDDAGTVWIGGNTTPIVSGTLGA